MASFGEGQAFVIAGHLGEGAVAGLPGGDMVGNAGEHIDGDGDALQVDRGAEQGEFVGFYQVVFEVELAEIPAVHGAGHVGVVAVPVEQIEWHRSFAEQVVVDDEVPDEVVRAEHGEGGGHAAAAEDAVALHLFFQCGELGFVGEEFEFARVGEVHEGGEEGGGGDAGVILGLHDGQRCAEHGAADAVADCVEAFFAGDGQGGVDRSIEAVGDVVFKTDVAVFWRGVLPADHEDLIALVDQELDQAVFGFEVEDIIPVYPWWADEQGLLVDLLGGWGILDEFDKVIAEDHVAWGDADVVADFKGGFIGEADAARLDIGNKIFEAVEEGFAFAFECRLLGFGVGEEEVGGAEGIGELLGVELDFGLVFGR